MLFQVFKGGVCVVPSLAPRANGLINKSGANNLQPPLVTEAPGVEGIRNKVGHCLNPACASSPLKHT